MTRFRDHLDDMPANGYAYSAVSTDRVPSFLALMFGHLANYQACHCMIQPLAELYEGCMVVLKAS